MAAEGIVQKIPDVNTASVYPQSVSAAQDDENQPDHFVDTHAKSAIAVRTARATMPPARRR
jgi:hypothetical protein